MVDQNPELAFMAKLDEHLGNFGPMTRGQVARAISDALELALDAELEPAALRRGCAWARSRAEADEAEAREASERRKRREADDNAAAPMTVLPDAIDGGPADEDERAEATA